MSAVANLSKNDRNYFFGWDMLFGLIRAQIKKKADIIMALIHFLLTKHSKLGCLGIGDDRTILSSDRGNELLPDNWNAHNSKYTLRYMLNNRIYILFGMLLEDADNTLVVNLFDVRDQQVTNMCLEPDCWIEFMNGTLLNVMPKAFEFSERVSNELVKPLLSDRCNLSITSSTSRLRSRQSTSLGQYPSYPDFVLDTDFDSSIIEREDYYM